MRLQRDRRGARRSRPRSAASSPQERLDAGRPAARARRPDGGPARRGRPRCYEAGYVGRAWPQRVRRRRRARRSSRSSSTRSSRPPARRSSSTSSASTSSGRRCCASATTSSGGATSRRSSRPRRSGARASPSPRPGSDLASLRTRAVEHDDHFVLSGQKTWVSWGQYARWCGVLARTDDDGAEAPRHLDADRRHALAGRRGAPDDADHRPRRVLRAVPRRRRRPEGEPPRRARRRLEDRHAHARPRARDRRAAAPGQAADVARPRRPRRRRAQLDGAPLLDDPEAQVALARALIGIEVLRHHAYRTVGEFLNGGAVGPDSSSVKLLMAEAEQRLAATALEVLGPTLQHAEPARPRRTTSGTRPTSTRARRASTAARSRSSATSSPTASSRCPRSSAWTSS